MLIVRDDTIKTNPDLVRRVTGALMRSINEARATLSEDEVYNLLVKQEPQIQKPEAVLQWKQFKEAVKNPGPIDPAAVEANLRYMAEGQDIKTDLKPEQLYTNEFIPAAR
jgi:ABC-type nitrate/sulfonate/bicarbonate transport system substrate-binding protein